MTLRLDLPSQAMRTGAGLHGYRAGRLLRQQPDQLWTGGLLAKQLASGAILGVQVKAVLAQVDADQCCIAHEDGLRN